MRILTETFHKALVHAKLGVIIDDDFLRRSDAEHRAIRDQYPKQSKDVRLGKFDQPPDENPYEEIDVEWTPDGDLRRIIGPLDQLFRNRINAISETSAATLTEYASNISNVVSVFSSWMRREAVVHVIGAGRALLAASLAANRLAHGGARVYILGDKAPPPSSQFGGGVIAASASGETPVVLEIMDFVQKLNRESRRPQIKVVGLSNPEAHQVGTFPRFPDLCTLGLFLGIRPTEGVKLRGLADLEEQAINQVLDALVVAAGLEIGVNFRLGHEDLVGGATGPHHRYSGV